MTRKTTTLEMLVRLRDGAKEDVREADRTLTAALARLQAFQEAVEQIEKQEARNNEGY